MIEKIKQHWLISIIVISSVVAGTTWKVALELLVYPRDFRISQLQEQVNQLREIPKIKKIDPIKKNEMPISSLVLSQTGVFENSSITTNDGICTVKINQASDYSIDLAVTIAANNPIEFKGKRPGERVVVNFENYDYYIDLQRVRGNIVDLAVYKNTK